MFYYNSHEKINVLIIFLLVAVSVFIFLSVLNCNKTRVEKQISEVNPEKLLDFPKENEKILLKEVVTKMNGKKKILVDDQNTETKGKDRVVKQRSDLDHKYYFVSAELPDRKKAANKLAEVYKRQQTLLQKIDENLSTQRKIIYRKTDITKNMRRLVKKHYQKESGFAEYHNPYDKTVGSNSDKGLLIEVCLRDKYKPSNFNRDNTIFRVNVHELAHSADKEFRGDGELAHGPFFYLLMDYLLNEAQHLGIYSCAEYKKSNREYCGLVLSEEDSFCS